MKELLRVVLEKIEAKPHLAFIGLSVLYFAGAGSIGTKRLMWYDELWTHYISRTPDITDIWRALSVLPEFIPPLSFVLTRFSFAVFGYSEFATRFPNMIGLWLGGLCLYVYCRKRFSHSSAIFAFLFLLLSGLYVYSYEARPYGLLIGLSAASFVSWHAYAEGKRRMLILLILSVAAAVSVHYYAVFVLLPLTAGEIMRARFVLRKAFPVVGAVTLSALLPILLFLPLILHNLEYASTFWARPRWAAIWETYSFIIGPAVWALAVIVVITIFLRRKPSDPARQEDSLLSKLPRHEVAAILAFVFIPPLGVILGKTITNAYVSRYGIHAFIGLAVLFTAFVHQALPSHPRAKLVLLFALSCFFLLRQVNVYQSFSSFREEQDRTFAFLRLNPELPLAVADPRYFFQLSHYATPDLAPRLVYLASPAMAKKYAGDSMLDDGLILMRNIAPLNIQAFESFRKKGQPFLIYWNPGPMSWLLSATMHTNCPLELKSQNGFQFIYYCKG